jgi:hypothetical protein
MSEFVWQSTAFEHASIDHRFDQLFDEERSPSLEQASVANIAQHGFAARDLPSWRALVAIPPMVMFLMRSPAGMA